MMAATEAAWFETRGSRRAPHHEGTCRRGFPLRKDHPLVPAKAGTQRKKI